MNIHDFDDIRPFLPEELPEVYDRLLANPDFQSVVQTVYQNVPFEQVAALMRSTTDQSGIPEEDGVPDAETACQDSGNEPDFELLGT